jgi:4-hydroxy-tetrahydrodipicolinate reductase
VKSVGIIGAGGRMGQNVAKAILETTNLKIGACIDIATSKYIGKDIGELIGVGKLGVLISTKDDVDFSSLDAVIDFSFADIILEYVDVIKKNRLVLVSGTTGHSDKTFSAFKELADDVPVLWSPNMSLGVNLLFRLVEIAAKSLEGYDIEIVEIHHKHKKDAPSGTAKKIYEIINSVSPKNPVYGREGFSERKENEIGIMALRGGDIVGEHDVMFIGEGERVVLSHKAHTRMTFARGAVFAVSKLFDKPPGFYTMQDILFEA